jgi:peptide deformylase
MEVLVYPNPLLRRGGRDIERFDDALREIAREMFEVMYRQKGVGLAAPQVGLDLNLLVLNPSGDARQPDLEMAIINPVPKLRKPLEWGEEGCLSFPGIYAEIERPQGLSLAFRDDRGEPRELELEGFLARIVQHEMDHLKGVLFIDRMSAADRLRVRAKLADLERRYKSPA